MTGKPSANERNNRRANRFPVSALITLGQKTAQTLDMSVSGVYFETDENYAPGSSLEFTVDLEHVRPEGPVRLVCTGRIVRVERRHGKVGVAVAFDAHRFEFIDEKPSSAAKVRRGSGDEDKL